jgi:hypothetical protein
MAFVAACGGRADTTAIEQAPPPPVAEPEAPPVFDVTQSQSLAALSSPEVREAFCGWFGAAAVGLGDTLGQPVECETVVDECRQAVQEPAMMGLGAPADGVDVPGDLEALLGCPVSLGELDACVAQLLDLVVERSAPGPACEPAAPNTELSFSDLRSLPDCVTVLVQCPELLDQLVELSL